MGGDGSGGRGRPGTRGGIAGASAVPCRCVAWLHWTRLAGNAHRLGRGRGRRPPWHWPCGRGVERIGVHGPTRTRSPAGGACPGCGAPPGGVTTTAGRCTWRSGARGLRCCCCTASPSSGTCGRRCCTLLAEDHRVLAWDMRGHGESRAGEEGVTLHAVATDVATVLERARRHRRRRGRPLHGWHGPGPVPRGHHADATPDGCATACSWPRVPRPCFPLAHEPSSLGQRAATVVATGAWGAACATTGGRATSAGWCCGDRSAGRPRGPPWSSSGP